MENVRPPAHSDELKVSFPSNHVLLVTLNRPRSLNAMTPTMGQDLNKVLNWFEAERSLWVVIITGAGKVFCAGADLKAWNTDQSKGESDEQETTASNVHGFGSVSRRSTSVKPMIAAVNGGAYGGGLEMVLNCDIVIAGRDAKFALPEVKRGVLAAQGAIPRLSKIAGHQLASELLLLGRTVSADEAQVRFRFVNAVVAPSEIISTAVRYAQDIVQNSPDAVQSTKRGLMLSQKLHHEEAVLAHIWDVQSSRVYKGDNIKEGLRAFSEKRSPIWKNPLPKL